MISNHLIQSLEPLCWSFKLSSTEVNYWNLPMEKTRRQNLSFVIIIPKLRIFALILLFLVILIIS